MTGWNLPPGCNVSDIPGNRPIDEAFDHWWSSDEWVEICLGCDEYTGCPYRERGDEPDCRYQEDAFDKWYELEQLNYGDEGYCYED